MGKGKGEGSDLKKDEKNVGERKDHSEGQHLPKRREERRRGTPGVPKKKLPKETSYKEKSKGDVVQEASAEMKHRLEKLKG